MATTPAKPATKKRTPAKKKLSVKDEKFVDLVAKGEPIGSAYRKAGHKGKSRATASIRLTNPNIAAALEERKAYFRAIADVEAKQIIGAQQEIAFASIEDALDDDGRLDFQKAKANGSAKLIKKISRQYNKYGQNVSVEFYSRTDALGQLADMLGLKQAPRANERDAELARLVDQIQVSAEENGTTYEQERDIFLQHYAGKLGVKPDIQDRLANDESPLIG